MNTIKSIFVDGQNMKDSKNVNYIHCILDLGINKFPIHTYVHGESFMVLAGEASDKHKKNFIIFKDQNTKKLVKQLVESGPAACHFGDDFFEKETFTLQK